MTKMPENMQRQMKQMLENLPRYNYKVIRFFKDKEQMQKAVDDFNNNGITNLISRTLTENYIEELYEMYIFMPREGVRALWSAFIGSLVGGILGYLHGSTIVSFPLLNPVSAGGIVVSTVLGAGIGAILLTTFISILTLFKPIANVEQGSHMLVVYEDRERRKDIADILKKYKSYSI